MLRKETDSMTILKNRLEMAIAACMFLFQFMYAGQSSVTWNILTDVQGKITKMSIVNPPTPLAIEREITIDVDRDGNPVRGDVKFIDAAIRELKPREVLYYWEELKGAHALWDYLASQGRVAIFAPKTAPLPLEAFGRQSRILTDDNREFIGKLNTMPSNPDWFILDVGGSPLNIYKMVIRELQQMK
jgi:hypothetical protein